MTTASEPHLRSVVAFTQSGVCRDVSSVLVALPGSLLIMTATIMSRRATCSDTALT